MYHCPTSKFKISSLTLLQTRCINIGFSVKTYLCLGFKANHLIIIEIILGKL